MPENLDSSGGAGAATSASAAPDAAGAADSQTLDLAHPSDGGGVSVEEVPPYSSAWADIVAPVARSLVQLLAAVILLPFLLIALFGAFDRTEDPITHVLDWGKTILPPLVGFGGAIVGYYFGTRGGKQGPPGAASDE